MPGFSLRFFLPVQASTESPDSAIPLIQQRLLLDTQVVKASRTGVARTTTYGYDFHTGQVTSARDADNGVSTLTGLDDVGRAIGKLGK